MMRLAPWLGNDRSGARFGKFPNSCRDKVRESLTHAAAAPMTRDDAPCRPRRHRDSGAGFGLDRKIEARAPFRPGTVIERAWLAAERVEREPQDGGRNAGAAGRGGEPLQIDAA